MSFYNKSSLLTIPTAYKQGKLYSVKPDDGSGDFTFTRSTSATRVNSDGLIEKARENLLLHSNQFDTTWQFLGVTVTDGQPGYDGSNDAWLLEIDANIYRRIDQSVTSSGVFTFSLYAKAGTLSELTLRILGSGSRAEFNLSTGTIGTIEGTYIDAKMESVGNGWYRCSITRDEPITSVQIYVDWSQTTAGNIYIQDAQLEAGLVATDYIETTTSTVSTGIVENVPRIDYSSGTPSLLLEPQRTNLFYYSEYSEYAGINVTREYVESPDGFTNALRVYETAANGQHFTPYRGSVVAGQTYSLSFFIKKGSYDEVKVYTQSLYISSIFTITFSTNNLTFTGSDIVPNSQKLENYGNGWYRVSGTVIPNNSGNFFIYAVVKDLTTYVGDPTKYTDYYGFQVEQGSYPTSYIPTYGTSVTRTIDAITNSVSYALSSGYTIFIELQTQSLTDSNDIEFKDALSNYVFRVGNEVIIGAGLFTQANTTGYNKFALQVDASGNYELFKNGSSVTSGLGIAHDIEVISSVAGQDVRQILVFEQALTDAECITLTT